ncbi:hypothetical protein CKO43_01850 [Rubrivivax gelatinosus]|uniref:Transmembrane protein n=1 Tax=Rubrivivax gelatinosus TaxID=28068 RepID=A0ABS1DP68_RUBGE|nr:hypothetical protein [Rubrivivax gelatinosus]
MRRQYDADNAGDEGDDFSLRRVLARLEREHLLDSKRGRFGRILRGPLAAAAVVVLGVLVLYEPPSRELDGEQLRGAEPAMQLQVNDVAGTTASLLALLREAGAEVSEHELEGGAREIAATVPASARVTVAARLRPFGVKTIPHDGVVRLEIHPR